MKKNPFTSPRYILLLLGWLTAFAAFAQTRQLSGRVTDRVTGQGLPGVTVLVTGTTVGASTNADGSFSLAAPASATTLTFSSIGYTTASLPIGTNPTFAIALAPDQKVLSEAVVVGYGSQAKADITGSVTQLSGNVVQNQPVQSFEQAIQGRTPGVVINQGSGKLGQGINIQVRGTSSVTASNQPLYVIDGIPITSADQSSGATTTEPLNPLADLNPNDIESISILKDASASAIYGSRASNGVVIITTKKGRQGETKVTAGYYYGVSAPTRERQFLNASQYNQLLGESLINAGYSTTKTLPGDFSNYFGLDYNSPYDTNWSNQAFRNQGHYRPFGDAANVSQYDFSASGGDAKTRFYLSGTFNDQKGIIVGNRFRRGSLRLNLDHSIRDNLKVGINTSLARTVNDRVAGDNDFSNPLQLNALAPTQPVIDPATGLFNAQTIYYNALIDQELGSNRAGIYRSFSSAYLNFVPIKGLTLRTEVGGDFLDLNEDLVRGAGTQTGGATGYAISAQTQAVNYTNNNTATYVLDLGTDHHLDVLAGESYQRSDTKLTSAEGRGFPTNDFTRVASAAVKTSGSQSTGTGYGILSYFARVNYNFQGKYLIGGSVRRDGSSRFGLNTRYGNFGAASVGYLLSEESFLKGNAVVNFLKLRASYGLTGNSEVGNFAARSLVGAQPYADQSGTFISSALGDNNLTWENTKQTDFGVEFGFLQNRITGEVDVYQKQTDKLLLNRQLQLTSGFSNVTQNVGALRNRGLEIALNGRILDGDFKWNLGANMSFNRNLITSLTTPIIPGGAIISRVQQGEPLGVFYTKRYAGVDPANGDALYYQADGSKSNDYGAAPDQKVGNPNPKFTGGVNTNFSFKGFDLSALGQFSYGNDIYNAAGVYQSTGFNNYLDNQTVDQLNRWQKPGDITDVPKSSFGSGNGIGNSSRFIQDGSFFRIKNVTLGYSLPADIANRGYMKSVRIYVTAQNLATFTKYTGYDPEVNTFGLGDGSSLYRNIALGHDFYTPPLAKTFLAGVNVGF
ncbi:SusC/RagA family TonB-linked outer membrane protein [Hymenobacter sp. BRD67]|uniref:SusC/RagA family TonB-linked outer membrane protein n=1 Tax=Hymenobacter sp. BRD67 TaxID=2675877 RepID=UPI001565DFD2|nr:TonB-dependent receptor [Hymenobacter sp. BRD67]QKG53603.1 TonB-dependent receptor [Hymenobacter sp. BRD67]